jgi:serine/threonine-protein kinase
LLDDQATITEGTLAALAASAPLSATIANPAAIEIALDSLPRLTLRGLRESLPASTPSNEHGDLVELGVIGEGGMGRVLLVEQRSLGREVAVKTLKEDATASDVAALVREARVAGALEHPSIVPVHALGVNRDGRPILVMKRIEGVTWRQLLDDPEHPAWATHLGEARAPLDANIDVLTAVCRALELAHARGVVHRDVKPENVMVGAYGEVYLVDWGIAIARGKADPTILGTPAYMAPEMVRSEPVDVYTDVYLLGATLHRVLTGRPRHSGRAVTDTLLAALLSEPATYAADVPAPLATLCNAACAAERASRPTSVRMFRETLALFRRHRSALAICDVARERLARLCNILDEANGSAPRDLASAYRLSAEARFGFAQSLEQFPEHEGARQGRVECIEVLADLELRQGHVETAAALLDEVPQAAASFAPRIAAARGALIESTRHDAKLRALAREHDPIDGRSARLVFLLGALAFAVLVSAVVRVFGSREKLLSARGLVVIAVPLLVITGIAGVAMRNEIRRNTFTRGVWGHIVLIELSHLANRLVGFARETPLNSIIATDLLLAAVCIAAGAIAYTPRLAGSALAFLAGLVALDRYPAYSADIYGVTILAGIAAAAWAYWSHARPAAPSD